MPCYHPFPAWRSKDGSVVFRASQGTGSSFMLPCGQCVGCRLERSRQWAVRCVHEASLHAESAFLTLTYDDDHLPCDFSLDKSHFQKFMKRLRKRFSGRKIRYFHCGEYGDETSRPHYHAILFGLDFSDKILWSQNHGNNLYSSALLDSIWSYGRCFIGDVTFESAAYVARYVLKKITGAAADHVLVDGCPGPYVRMDFETGELFPVKPEYVTMSTKPGLGADWIDFFRDDVFPDDFVISRGVPVSVPRYYRVRDAVAHPATQDMLKVKRVRSASKRKGDSTPERLAVREHVKLAQISSLKRSLE